MARNRFSYSIHAEGNDGSLGKALEICMTQRRAFQFARHLARQTLPMDDRYIVVMRRPEGGCRLDDQVLRVFPFHSNRSV